MATPIMQNTSSFLQLQLVSAQRLVWIAQTTANPPVPIDIHTGYTAEVLMLPNQVIGGYAAQLGSLGTFTFGADGTLTLDLPFNVISGTVPSSSGTFQVQLSNDTFSTYSVIANGQYQVN